MNNWQFEQIRQIDESYRVGMCKTMEAERLYRRSRAYRPGASERTMVRLADWMISHGRRLRKRYELPRSVCCQHPSGNYI